MQDNSDIQPYATLQPVADDLWTLDGEWYGTRFKRRMTVIRLKSGGLVVHNPIRLKDEDYPKLDQIGKVEFIVAPNTFHSSDAHFYKNRYPQAKLWVAKGAAKSVGKLCKIDGLLPEAFQKALAGEVECFEFEGTRLLNESVFFHPASRTLIVTDMVFNMRCEVKGLEKAFFRWNKIDHRFGPSRIFRRVFVNSPANVQKTLSRILQWDFERVIMNHGEILEQGGKNAVIQGFAEVGIQLGRG